MKRKLGPSEGGGSVGGGEPPPIPGFHPDANHLPPLSSSSSSSSVAVAVTNNNSNHLQPNDEGHRSAGPARGPSTNGPAGEQKRQMSEQEKAEYHEKLKQSLNLTNLIKHVRYLWNRPSSGSESDSEPEPDYNLFPPSPATGGGGSAFLPSSTSQELLSLSVGPFEPNESSSPATSLPDDLLRYTSSNPTTGTGGNNLGAARAPPPPVPSSFSSIPNSVRSSVNGSMTTKSTTSSSSPANLSEDEQDSTTGSQSQVMSSEESDSSSSDDEGGEGEDSDIDPSVLLSTVEVNRLLEAEKKLKEDSSCDDCDFIDGLTAALREVRTETAKKQQQKSKVATMRRPGLRKLSKTEQTLAGAMSTFKTPILVPPAPAPPPPPQGTTSLSTPTAPPALIKTEPSDSAIANTTATTPTEPALVKLEHADPPAGPPRKKKKKFDADELETVTTQSTTSLDSYFKVEKRGKARSVSSVSSFHKKPHHARPASARKLEELNQKRKKVYTHICTKDVPKAYHNWLVNLQEKKNTARRVARMVIGRLRGEHLMELGEGEVIIKEIQGGMVAVVEESITFHRGEGEKEEDELLPLVAIAKAAAAVTEVRRYCQLSVRQKKLFEEIRGRINPEDLTNTGSVPHVALFTQLRKVCNHPDLLQVREVRSPLRIQSPTLTTAYFPRAVKGIMQDSFQDRKGIYENMGSIYHPESIHRSLAKVEDLNVDASARSAGRGRSGAAGGVRSEWSFLRFIGGRAAAGAGASSDSLSLLRGDFGVSLQHISEVTKSLELQAHSQLFHQCGAEAGVALLVAAAGGSIATRTPPKISLILETSHSRIAPTRKLLIPLQVPAQLFCYCDKVSSNRRPLQTKFRSEPEEHQQLELNLSKFINPDLEHLRNPIYMDFKDLFPHRTPIDIGLFSERSFSQLIPPRKDQLISDSGKLAALHDILKTLKTSGSGGGCGVQRRVLLFCQLTQMLNLLEQYLKSTGWTYCRPKTYEKCQVAPTDTFVVLCSSRTMKPEFLDRCDELTKLVDTVIFYDNNWNPTFEDQIIASLQKSTAQQMLTVYRLICEGTFEERVILASASEEGGGISHFPQKSELVTLLLNGDENLVKKFSGQPMHGSTAAAVASNLNNSEESDSTTSSSDDNMETNADVIDLDVVDGHGPRNDDDSERNLEPKPAKISRGIGRRGRPPARIRFPHRDYDGRRPGRPRVKPFGPANQAVRGRGRPGRPPLIKKPLPPTTPTPISPSSSSSSSSAADLLPIPPVIGINSSSLTLPQPPPPNYDDEEDAAAAAAAVAFGDDLMDTTA